MPACVIVLEALTCCTTGQFTAIALGCFQEAQSVMASEMVETMQGTKEGEQWRQRKREKEKHRHNTAKSQGEETVQMKNNSFCLIQ